MRKKLIALVVFFTIASTVQAEEKWELVFTPFLWASGQSGDVATLPGAETAEIDLSFSDIADNLDNALMGVFDARKGSWGLFAELFYIDIDTDEIETPLNLFSAADYEQQFSALTLGASRRFMFERTAVDLLVGIRFWEVDNKLSLTAGILPATKIEGKEDWTDVVVGVRVQRKLNETWSAGGWLVSAVSGDSDSAWDILVGVNYALNESLLLVGGYRHQNVDFDENGFLYDVELSGPVFGATFVF